MRASPGEGESMSVSMDVGVAGADAGSTPDETASEPNPTHPNQAEAEYMDFDVIILD